MNSFTVDNLYVSSSSDRTPYQAGEDLTPLLYSKKTCHILGLMLFLNIYGKDDDYCICVASDNSYVDIVAPLYPNIMFHVYGGTSKTVDNVRYVNETLDDRTAEEYRSQRDNTKWRLRSNVILFTSINSGIKVIEDVLISSGVKGEDQFIMSKVANYVDAIEQGVRDHQAVVIQDMETSRLLYEAIRPRDAFMRFRVPTNTTDLNGMQMLEGILFWPVYGKEMFRDTWLKPTSSNLSYWNSLDYESWIYHHNVNERLRSMYYNIFNDLPEFIYGNELLNDYDSSAEALILSMYIERDGVVRSREDLYSQVIQLWKLIHKDDKHYYSFMRHQLNPTKGMYIDPFINHA